MFFLRYAKNNKWYVESGVTGYSKRYSYQVNKTSVTDQHLPGFVRLDASADAQITLAINNILNKKYWRSDSRPGDERSFMVNFHYNF